MRRVVEIHVDDAAVVHLNEVLSVVMPPVRESRYAEIIVCVCASKMEKSIACSECYLKGALGADAVADRMRFHASKEEGIVDVDLKLLPKLEKSEAESRPRFV